MYIRSVIVVTFYSLINYVNSINISDFESLLININNYGFIIT